jgi:Putative auto-transporter adhesin, head GIN domain
MLPGSGTFKMEVSMKIADFRLLAVSVATVILAAGCIVIDLDGCSKKKVKGSGNLISEERQVSEFNQIVLKGMGKITLASGEQQNLNIKTDDNIVSLIETTVRNGELKISHNAWNIRPTTLEFLITVKDLKGVAVSGSGNISGKDRFFSEDFFINVSGSGNISLDLETQQLDSDVSGSGLIRLAGKSNSHDASITGSGKIRAFDMETRNASISITGSGDCNLNVSEKLQAKVTGSGDLRYKGRPQLSTKVTGSGSVENEN